MTRALSIAALAGSVLLYGALAPSPAAAQADCTQWRLSDGWYAIQGSYRIRFMLQQAGTNLSGTAFLSTPPAGGIAGSFGTRDAPYGVRGSVKGNALELFPTGGGIGVYLGKIDSTGRIDGTTYDPNNSRSQATWYSDRRMTCIARASDAPPPPKPTPAPAPVPSRSTDTLATGQPSGASAFRNLVNPGGSATPPPGGQITPAPERGPIAPAATTRTATAKNDVDVYSSPTQPRRVIAMMRKGTQAPVLEFHSHGWCKLDIASPRVTGWVARDHLNGCQ
jgi:hypothetical protein